MRNIELKARVSDLAAVRQTAAKLATERLGRQHQLDTYFLCRQGRLKLREIDGIASQLIWYARPDEDGPKPSDYMIVPVPDPKTLKAALAAALGVRVSVDKSREIFLVDNVRIHLDQVAELGSFLEFEAVLGPDIDDGAGRSQLDHLARQFALGPQDLVSGSYSDLMQDASSL